MSARRSAVLAPAALLGASCDRSLTALNPAGPQAERIADLTTLLVVLGASVFVVVIGFLLFAVRRGARRTVSAAGADVERRMTIWVSGAVAITIAILLVVLVANLGTGRLLATYADPEALVVRVVGHQWWWEVEYLDPRSNRRLTTANEIHIPVGQRIRLETESRDVIHSFWAPRLHGKIDLIPGYRGTTYIQADHAGVYEGRCAEFCGHQHARMGFLVIAESRDEFEAWYEAQLRPAPPPSDSLELEGQRVFLARGCVMCHTVRGTPAGSNVGPDLTHVASRRTIAAGTLPNTRGHLAGWVVDPQRIKPGARMPPNALASADLEARLAYLESLR